MVIFLFTSYLDALIVNYHRYSDIPQLLLLTLKQDKHLYTCYCYTLRTAAHSGALKMRYSLF